MEKVSDTVRTQRCSGQYCDVDEVKVVGKELKFAMTSVHAYYHKTEELPKARGSEHKKSGNITRQPN